MRQSSYSDKEILLAIVGAVAQIDDPVNNADPYRMAFMYIVGYLGAEDYLAALYPQRFGHLASGYSVREVSR